SLPSPFFVLATQNPIEQEGTYPLPEAQLDRFMFELRVGYPSKDEEERIVESTTGDVGASITPVLTAEDVLALQHLVRRIPVPQPLVRAAVTLVRMTRPPDAEAPPFIKQFVSWGAGPRASQYLILGAKGRAALDGRPMPDEDDLRAVAPTVLTHRLVINFGAEAPGPYNSRCGPVARGPDRPARAFGRTAGNVMTLTVALTDPAVTLGPVQLQFGKEPRMGPCPICRRPGAGRGRALGR